MCLEILPHQSLWEGTKKVGGDLRVPYLWTKEIATNREFSILLLCCPLQIQGLHP